MDKTFKEILKERVEKRSNAYPNNKKEVCLYAVAEDIIKDLRPLSFEDFVEKIETENPYFSEEDETRSFRLTWLTPYLLGDRLMFRDSGLVAYVRTRVYLYSREAFMRRFYSRYTREFFNLSFRVMQEEL